MIRKYLIKGRWGNLGQTTNVEFIRQERKVSVTYRLDAGFDQSANTTV